MYLFDYAKGVAVRKLQLHTTASLRVSGPQDGCHSPVETAAVWQLGKRRVLCDSGR